MLLNQGKSSKLISRVLHILLCLFISIWIAEKCGYVLNATDLSVKTINNLFSGYFLLLGLTLFFLTMEIISILNAGIQMLFHLFYVKDLVHTKPIEAKYTFSLIFASLMILIRTIDSDGSKMGKKFLQQKIKDVQNDFSTLQYVLLTMASFIFCYDLVVRVKFPIIHFWLFSILLYLIYFCLTILYCVMLEYITVCKNAIQDIELKEQST